MEASTGSEARPSWAELAARLLPLTVTYVSIFLHICVAHVLWRPHPGLAVGLLVILVLPNLCTWGFLWRHGLQQAADVVPALLQLGPLVEFRRSVSAPSPTPGFLLYCAAEGFLCAPASGTLTAYCCLLNLQHKHLLHWSLAWSLVSATTAAVKLNAYGAHGVAAERTLADFLQRLPEVTLRVAWIAMFAFLRRPDDAGRWEVAQTACFALVASDCIMTYALLRVVQPSCPASMGVLFSFVLVWVAPLRFLHVFSAMTNIHRCVRFAQYVSFSTLAVLTNRPGDGPFDLNPRVFGLWAASPVLVAGLCLSALVVACNSAARRRKGPYELLDPQEEVRQDGWRALCQAVKDGDRVMAAFLVDLGGAEIRDARSDEEDRAPLALVAARHFQPEVWENLALRGLEGPVLDLADDDGQTALGFAVSRKDPQLVRAVLLAGAGCQLPPPGLAHTALEHWDAEVWAMLAQAGDDLRAVVDEGDAKGQTALRLAVELRHAEAVKALLDAGARLECAGGGQLATLALEHYSSDVWQSLERRGLAKHCEAGSGAALLELAIRHQAAAAVQTLLEAGAPLAGVEGPEGGTAVHLALKCWDVSTWCALAPHVGPIIDKADSHGVVPLGLAVQQLHKAHVEAVLQAGASCDKVLGPLGGTVVHLAIDHFDEAIWLCLAKRLTPALLDVADRRHQTPLSVAVRRRRADVCELLLDNQASMAAVATESGGSLAHLALSHYDAGVWQVLHKRGLAQEVDLGAADLAGVTPAMLAADKEHQAHMGAAPGSPRQHAGLVAEVLAAGDLSGALLTIEGADATDLKHDGIALGSDGRLYCAPANAAEILVVDPRTRELSRLPVPPGPRKYSGIARGQNGSLYCAPFNASAVLVIDPDGRLRTLPLPLDGPGKFCGIALGPDGRLYCAPHNASAVLVIGADERLSFLEGAGFGGAKFSGICAAQGRLFCCPYNCPDILCIDPAQVGQELSYLNGAGNQLFKYSGIAQGSDGLLYCAPYAADRVLQVDPSGAGSLSPGHFARLPDGKIGKCTALRDGQAEVEEDGVTTWYRRELVRRSAVGFLKLPEGFGGDAKCSGIAGVGDRLYCAPRDARSVLAVANGACSSLPMLNDAATVQEGKYRGITAGPDGVLYCAPCRASSVLGVVARQ